MFTLEHHWVMLICFPVLSADQVLYKMAVNQECQEPLMIIITHQ